MSTYEYKKQQQAAGLCVVCGKPRRLSKKYCDKHLLYYRLYFRRRLGVKPWEWGNRGRPPLASDEALMTTPEKDDEVLNKSEAHEEEKKAQIAEMAIKRFGRGTELRYRRDSGGPVYWIALRNNKQAMAARSLSVLVELLAPTKTALKKERKAARMNAVQAAASPKEEPNLVASDVIARAVGLSESAVYTAARKGVIKKYGTKRKLRFDKDEAVKGLQEHMAKSYRHQPRSKKKRVVYVQQSGQNVKLTKSPAAKRDAVRALNVMLPVKLHQHLHRAVTDYNYGPAKVTLQSLVEWLLRTGLAQLDK